MKNILLAGQRYLAIDIALDESLPLLDHGPQLVCGEVHPVEVGDAVLALQKLTSHTQ
jgi:hypothetical protein